MSEHRYWYIASGYNDECGGSVNVLSVPWWPEARKWVHKTEGEYIAAPKLYTTKEGAEEELREFQQQEPDDYLRLVNENNEEVVNMAFENSAPPTVFAIDREMLLDKLIDSDFLCVVVDEQFMFREKLVEELSGHSWRSYRVVRWLFR